MHDLLRNGHFLPLHQRNLIFGQAIEGVDEAVDFGFEARNVRAVGIGEDLLHTFDDRGLLGFGGSGDRKCF